MYILESAFVMCVLKILKYNLIQKKIDVLEYP